MRAITGLFYQRLEAIEHYLNLLADLRQLGGSKPAVSVERTIIGRRATAVRGSLREHTHWETISLDGCVLSLAAEFELAALDLAEWLARELCQKVATYADLPESMKKENLRLVGDFLKGVGKPWLGHINHVQIISELANSTTNGVPAILFSRGFGMNNRNLRSGELSGVYGRSRVRGLWNTLGGNPWMRAYFGGASQSKKLAMDKLDQFMEYRNQIAHRGAHYSTLGPSTVRDFVVFFKCLMGALSLALEDHVATFP